MPAAISREKKAAVLREMVNNGGEAGRACVVAGLPERAYYHLLSQDPVFREKVKAARLAGKLFRGARSRGNCSGTPPGGQGASGSAGCPADPFAPGSHEERAAAPESGLSSHRAVRPLDGRPVSWPAGDPGGGDDGP